ncbi:MAG: addiction module protein [Rhodospirillales bacterium]|nr:addiction module protein [Rhodospirillales bacterium]
MNERVKELSQRARKLTPKERVELVDDILSSLTQTSTKLDAAWTHEAEARLEAYHRGELRALPMDAIRTKYQSP